MKAQRREDHLPSSPAFPQLTRLPSLLSGWTLLVSSFYSWGTEALTLLKVT